jgi:2-methylaconitate cis-trans-isomerase PrpF
MRGGTSKGVFLHEKDVPADRNELVTMILDLFGSPDRRQIDGLGGADKLTSKVAIIGHPIIPDSDLTFLFGQVGVAAAEVDFKPNCGNLTAAVGMYAIQEGFVKAVDGVTTVRIHNINTNKIIHADVRVRDGAPIVEGDLAIGGVPGTGSPISLDFSRAAGSTTGRLLPMGAATINLQVPGHPSIDVSVVDCANLVIFAAAEGLGLTGQEKPLEIDRNQRVVDHINAIRKVVAHEVGLGEYWDARVSPAIPMFVAVAQSSSYATFTGGQVAESSIDLVCRSYAAGSTHQALAATATACTGVACRIPGSVASRYLSARAQSRDLIEIGHASGVIAVESRIEAIGDGYKVHWSKILRTARRLAEGTAYLKSQNKGHS